MITMNELVDLRMQQHIAHEIYRQQIMQRIPDPFPHMLGMGVGGMPMAARHMLLPPPRVTLPGVEVTLQNDDLWQQFHQIGTEMIITKSGRRMFPSMRLTVAGLEEESNYCVLLEMVPIGDCRFKFSGSQWVPAGGAEPQSPQRMFLHPDSPATGAHWQSQAILFNKVKLTNNTLDSSGHVVLASMHKYQPRIHVIRTADLTQIPWAPQQAFVFPETEFVAVTAYQNDRITKLKIDNNPFAKGFRETGQSRCKRKMSSSLSDDDQEQQQPLQQPYQAQQQQQQRRLNMLSPVKCTSISMDATINGSSSGSGSGSKPLLPHANSGVDVNDIDDDVVVVVSGGDAPQIKRLRSNGSASSTLSTLDEPHNATDANAGNYNSTSNSNNNNNHTKHNHHLLMPQASAQHGRLATAGSASAVADDVAATSAFMHHLQQNMQTLLRPSLAFDFACTYFARTPTIYAAIPPTLPQHHTPEQHLHAYPPPPLAAYHHLQNENLSHSIDVLPNRIAAATNSNATTTTTTTTSSKSTPPPMYAPIAEEPLNVVECESNDCDKNAETKIASSSSSSSPALRAMPPSQSPATIGKRKGFSISAILGGNS